MTAPICQSPERETLLSQHECRRKAAWCERMAFESTNQETRTAWLMMAENWTAMIPHALLREWDDTPSPHSRARRKASANPALNGSLAPKEQWRRKATASAS